MEDDERKQILIVDFDHEFLIQEQILLEDEGFEVTTTWSTWEACDLLSNRRFDLVLLGDYLPDAGERGFWSLLRRIPADTEVAVVRSTHPTISQIGELLRDHVQHCALPRRTPVEIADGVIQCLRRRSMNPTIPIPRSEILQPNR